MFVMFVPVMILISSSLLVIVIIFVVAPIDFVVRASRCVREHSVDRIVETLARVFLPLFIAALIFCFSLCSESFTAALGNVLIHTVFVPLDQSRLSLNSIADIAIKLPFLEQFGVIDDIDILDDASVQ